MIRAIFEVANPGATIEVSDVAADVRYRYAEAQTDWVALSGDIEYVNMQGSLEYVNLVGQLRYVNLQAANVYADPTPPDRWVNDFQVTADQLLIIFEKAAADSASAVDAHRVSTHKRPSETASAEDSYRSLFRKASSDLQAVADQAPTFSVGKGLSDIQAITESLVRSMSVAKFDTATAVDQQLLNLSKPLADSYDVSDLSFIGFLANKSDNVSTVDNKLFDLSKLLSDTALTDDRFSIEDELQQAIGKSLADGFSVSDSQQIVVSFSRSFAETEYAIDYQEISFLKGNSDSAGTSDSGALFMTDYADITYFAEDYVGVSRTF
jgi:hypothetical protein